MPAPDLALARALAELCAEHDGHLVLPRRVFLHRVADRLPPDHEIAGAIRRGYFSLAVHAIRDARPFALAQYGVSVARVRTAQIRSGYRVALANVQAANTD